MMKGYAGLLIVSTQIRGSLETACVGLERRFLVGGPPRAAGFGDSGPQDVVSACTGHTGCCHCGVPGGSGLSQVRLVVGEEQEGESLPLRSDLARSDTRRTERSEIRRVSDLPRSESRRPALDWSAARGPIQFPCRRALGCMDAANIIGRPTGPPGPNLRALRTSYVATARCTRTQPNLTAAEGNRMPAMASTRLQPNPTTSARRQKTLIKRRATVRATGSGRQDAEHKESRNASRGDSARASFLATTSRPAKQDGPGLWGFPGGKTEGQPAERTRPRRERLPPATSQPKGATMNGRVRESALSKTAELRGRSSRGVDASRAKHHA